MTTRRWAPWLAAALVSVPACIVKQDKEEPQGTAGTGGAAGSAGSPGGECEGGITAGGVCEGTQAVFCQEGVVERVDCSQIEATCAVTDGRADCQLERAASCGSLTALGTCAGATLRYCDDSGLASVPREINCAAYGQKCDPTGATDGGAICVPQGPCPTGLTEIGRCDGNKLTFCEEGEQYTFDCGVDTCGSVGGFADCLVVGVTEGCGSETPAGRCEGTTRVSCQGNIVAREDCARLGLACRADGQGANRCLSPTSCSVACPAGTTCQSGKCTAAQTPAADWTFMVYIVGDNDLSNAAWKDLNEMETVGSSAKVNILAMVEFSKTYSQYSQYDYSQWAGPVYRMKVQKDSNFSDVTSLKSAENRGNIKLSDPKYITEFVRWGVEKHPAKRYALVMWDHGAGYKDAYIDGGGSLSLGEIVDGIRNSGVHLDLVAFDACYMGMHEVAYAMRGFADVMVGSEDVEPGDGYPYDLFLPRLASQPAMPAADLGKAIVEEYTKDYSSGFKTRSVTNSVIDLTKIESTHEKIGSLVGALHTDLPGKRSLARTLADSPDILRFSQSENADFYTALNEIAPLGPSTGAAAGDLKTWLTTSGTIVKSEATGSRSAARGLAIFLAQPGDWYSSYDLETYKNRVSFLPLQPWISFSTVLTEQSDPPVPGTGAVKSFRALLTWGDTQTSDQSAADLDLYVFEPNGDFGTPANGITTENGFLSADSYDTDVPVESYELSANHQPGTYIVLVHYYGGPTGNVAYPKLQIFRDDLPGGSRTLLRAKVIDKKLAELPMSNEKPLTQKISSQNFQGVLNLEYTNIWYATTIEVE
jgi:hypothetical protein